MSTVCCILRAMPCEVPNLIRRVFNRKQRRKLARFECGLCNMQLDRSGCGAIDWFDDLSRACSAKVRYYRARQAARSDRRRGPRQQKVTQ